MESTPRHTRIYSVFVCISKSIAQYVSGTSLLSSTSPFYGRLHYHSPPLRHTCCLELSSQSKWGWWFMTGQSMTGIVLPMTASFFPRKPRASWRKHAHQCSSSRQHRENGSWSRRHWLSRRHLLTTVTPASQRWVVMATSRISQFPVEGLNFSMVLRRVFPSYLVW